MIPRYYSKSFINSLANTQCSTTWFPQLIIFFFDSNCSQLWSNFGIAPKEEGHPRVVIGQVAEAVTQPVFSYKTFANLEDVGYGLVKGLAGKRTPLFRFV